MDDMPYVRAERLRDVVLIAEKVRAEKQAAAEAEAEQKAKGR